MRQAKTFTISAEILSKIASTKGVTSTIARVNELQKRALDLERRERLELEAAEFFSNYKADAVPERHAYQKASKEALSGG